MVGGVGAFECEGVPELVELDLVIGIDVCLLGSVSISIGIGAEEAAG